MLTPLVEHAAMQGGCYSRDQLALKEWKERKRMRNGDPGIIFGGPRCGSMVYYWPEIGGYYADMHKWFEASRVDPEEEAEYLNAVLSDESDDVDVVTPTTDLGSLTDLENRSALCLVEEGEPRGDPKMSDAEWFSKEPACDHGDQLVVRDIMITQAAFSHTRLEGKIKFFVSGGKEA